MKCPIALGLILKTISLFKVKNNKFDEFIKLICC